MDKIEEILTRGVENVYPTKKTLENLLRSGKKIKLYQGFDPSASSLHFGNLVGAMKLRQFQKLGHKVIFLIGDFTGMIGDPTDKDAVRKQLTREEVTKNAENWKSELKNILDFEGDNPVEIMRNSKWSDKITFKDLIGITSNFTVQQMIERDMFQERIKKEKPIYLHEFLYPIAQGYDSVVMDVDLEIGGNDQTFNMLAGRTLMKQMLDKEKYVLTTKLMIDKEGRKVGKTTGNALFVSSGPEKFFGGIMSFPDEVINLGFELLTEIDLKDLKEKIKKDPMTEKKRLAYEVVKLIWNEKEAKKAQKKFEDTFQKGEADYSREVPIQDNWAGTIAPFTSNQSTSEAKRLINQGSVLVNGEKINDPFGKPEAGQKVKIGKLTFGTITEK